MENYELGFTPNNLKKLIKELNLSIVEASALVEVHQSTFYRYLNDEDKITTMPHEKFIFFRNLLEERNNLKNEMIEYIDQIESRLIDKHESDQDILEYFIESINFEVFLDARYPEKDFENLNFRFFIKENEFYKNHLVEIFNCEVKKKESDIKKRIVDFYHNKIEESSTIDELGEHLKELKDFMEYHCIYKKHEISIDKIFINSLKRVIKEEDYVNYIIHNVSKINGFDWLNDIDILSVLIEMILDNRAQDYIIKNLNDVITLKEIVKNKS